MEGLAGLVGPEPGARLAIVRLSLGHVFLRRLRSRPGGAALRATSHGETGHTWSYSFETSRIKQPLFDLFASAGWEPDGATRALDVDDLLVPQVRFHVAL